MPHDNKFLLKRAVSSGTINERLSIRVADDDDGSSISGIDNIPLSIPADVSGDVPSSETTMRSNRDAFWNVADDDDGSSISGIDNIPLSFPADVSGDVPSSETTIRSNRDAF